VGVVSGNLLDGFDACIGKLEQLGDLSAAAAALEAAAALVAGTAKGMAPVDTGALRNSIGYSVSRHETGAAATIYATAEYAPYVEFGTGGHGAASSVDTSGSAMDPGARPSYTLDHRGQAARPFMYPAFKACESEIEKMIMDAILGALE
jgi:HK97 gp10 family phage protein